MSKCGKAVASIVLAMGLNGALCAAAADAAQADAARRKPLQRCDQLNDKAELECLRKARDRIVEVRKKRESTADKSGDGSGKSARTADAPSQKTR